MKRKIKFGFSTLLALALSMQMALAQDAKTNEKNSVTQTSAEYQTLKQDWADFQVKAEKQGNKASQKPQLEKAYNTLVERVELLCEGIQPQGKTLAKPLSTATTAPAAKPKQEQVTTLK